MTETDLIPVFDGHNDTLLKLYQSGKADVEKLFIEGSPASWHIDLPRARKGGLAGGMFAIFPQIVQTVFAENCVAVVFLLAVILNLILPGRRALTSKTSE